MISYRRAQPLAVVKFPPADGWHVVAVDYNEDYARHAAKEAKGLEVI
jgi:hypothetical protein